MTYFLQPEICKAARILSTENGDVRARRAAERLMARSPDALWLYRLRGLQCAWTTAKELRAGRTPPADLGVAWLRSRTADLAGWREVEEALEDAVLSLERCQDAEKLRQELLVAPDEAVDAWVTEEDELDYLVAWVCLVAEEVHRPLGGDEADATS